MRNLLIQEYPLMVLPSLVKEVGSTTKAMLLQQIHFLCGHPAHAVEHEGHYWIAMTYDQWVEEYFTWMTSRGVQNALLQLEKSGHITTTDRVYNEWDSTKFYRVSMPENGVHSDETSTVHPSEPSRVHSSAPPLYNIININREDAALEVLATHYANPWGKTYITNEVAKDRFLDSHAALVERYGIATYEEAVKMCVGNEYADGRDPARLETFCQKAAKEQEQIAPTKPVAVAKILEE